MTSRPPSSPLHQRLRTVYARVRRALALRHALRAAAAACVLLAFAVTAGLALPRTPAFASARLVLVLLGSVLAIGFAVGGARREAQPWDTWLESLEARFAGLRSWLRNALDLESTPATHTSGELAQAVRGETARRLDQTPLEETVPRLETRTPLVATTAALLSLVAAVVFAPQATLDAWRTLWQPAIAAPAVTIVVEPGDV